MWRITHAQQQPKQAPDDGNGAGGDPSFVHDITPPGSTSNTPSPVQQRIAEITAEKKAALERASALEETNRQLMAQFSQAMAQMQVQRQPEPQAPAVPQFQIPEGMDPGVASLFQQQQAAFQAMLAQSQKQTEAIVAQATGRVAQTTAQLQMEQALNGQPPEVRQLATRLFMDWQRAGNTGWAPQDAIIYARGQLGVTGPAARVPSDPNTVVPGGSTPGAMVAAGQMPGQIPPPLSDEAISKMTLSQEEAYYRKRLEAQGGVDQPLLLR